MEIYKEIKIKPNSEEWHLYRRTHLGASDSAAILGKSPWASAIDCYKAKIEGKKSICTPAMQRGTMLEPKARDLLIAIHGINLEDKVYESIKYPFMHASLDAISNDCKRLYEIKCGGENTMNKAFKGEIDPSYIIQCHKQMLVMGLEEMHLFYYFNEFLYHDVLIERDEKLIKQIIKAETNFWNNHILKQIPPEKYGDDYERIEDEKANELAQRWQELNEREKTTKLEKENVAKQLEKYTKEKNCIFPIAGIKHQFIERKGAVNWADVRLSFNISEEDLEKYRKERTTFSKFSEM